jgi:hypothetical protein
VAGGELLGAGAIGAGTKVGIGADVGGSGVWLGAISTGICSGVGGGVCAIKFAIDKSAALVL